MSFKNLILSSLFILLLNGYTEETKKDKFLKVYEEKTFRLHADRTGEHLMLGTNKFLVPYQFYSRKLISELSNFIPNQVTLKGVEGDYVWGNVGLWGGLFIAELGGAVALMPLFLSSSSSPLSQGATIGLVISGLATFKIGEIIGISGGFALNKGKGKIFKAIHDYNKNIIEKEFSNQLGVRKESSQPYLIGLSFLNVVF